MKLTPYNQLKMKVLLERKISQAPRKAQDQSAESTTFCKPLSIHSVGPEVIVLHEKLSEDEVSSIENISIFIHYLGRWKEYKTKVKLAASDQVPGRQKLELPEEGTILRLGLSEIEQNSFKKELLFIRCS